jgi:hypothetical protein
MTNSLDQKEPDKLQGNWNYPTAVRFGVGRCKELPEIYRQLNMHKPLLVTDAGLTKQSFLADIIKLNQAGGVPTAVFSDVKSNPTGANVEAGVNVYHQGKHDGVIALGGGSALDAGKAIALMVGQKRSLWDFEDVGDNWRRVETDGMAPTIAIPTTAGTGSEVGRASVIVDESCYQKKVIFHPKMLPAVVIADPMLTQGLPPAITAATGMDAFVHNLEAYCALGYHPMADGIALEGMRLIKEWLPIAFSRGDVLAARSHMLVASSMGATAFQKGLGAVHALAHPLGALFDKHHGLLNAILLPYVLVQNKPAIEAKLTHVARCLDLPDSSFSGFMSWLLEFRASLNIPADLKAIGIGAEKSALIGQMAAQDPSASGNPVSFTPERYAEIFLDAVNGSLR